jgi:hypothetical protein
MRSLKPYSIVITLLFVVLSGCKFNRTFLNDEDDKNQAMQVIGKFYYYMGTKDYNQVFSLFGKQFYQVASKNKLKELFTLTSTRLGDLKDTNIGEWETKRIEGTDPTAEYELRYNNTYTKYEASETFRLVREDDGKIMIIYYGIKSDGLK